MDDDPVGVALVLLSAVGFSTLAIFGKLAADAGLSIPTVLSLRFLVAALVVWLVLVASGEATLLSGRELTTAFGLGAVGYALMSGFYFWGLAFMTAGLVGIVFYTYPAFVVVLSRAALDERISRETALALMLALGGVAFITGFDPTGADQRGVAVVLAGAVVYAGYITVGHAALSSVDARTLTAHVLPAGAASCLAFGAATGTLSMPASGYEWGLVVALAVIATAVPIFAFFAGLARIGANRTSIVSTTEPVATVALGVLLLDEAVTASTVFGGALVLAGVVVLER
jgi:drug/metabolite transporter (DMT)-like permease